MNWRLNKLIEFAKNSFQREIGIFDKKEDKRRKDFEEYFLRNKYSNEKPTPTRITDYELIPRSDYSLEAQPKFMGQNGIVYGTSGIGSRREIFKSEDCWKTVEEILEIPDGYGGLTNAALVESDTGRLVICTDEGAVFVTDEEKLSVPDTPEFEFSSGYPTMSIGFHKYRNYILLAEYGGYDEEDPPRRIYASQDDGETWHKILEISLDNIPDPSQFHIHNVRYDYFIDRIWVVTGDGGGNSFVYYSDNFGDDWSRFNAAMLTSISIFEHGITFGTDTEPMGLRHWIRPQNILRPEIILDDEDDGHWKNEDTLIRDYLRFFTPEESDLQGWARNSYVTDEGIHVIPFHTTSREIERSNIIATKDGINWYEVFRYNDLSDNEREETHFWNLVGPHSDDEKRKVCGFMMKGGSPHIFRATGFPKWK